MSHPSSDRQRSRTSLSDRTTFYSRRELSSAGLFAIFAGTVVSFEVTRFVEMWTDLTTNCQAIHLAAAGIPPTCDTLIRRRSPIVAMTWATIEVFVLA